jgi:hypothetical protein
MPIGDYDVKAHPLEFALYLEGVRVPFVSATVSSAPNRPSTCVIELPPFSAATRLRPKTLVHLLYLDTAFINPDLTESAPQPEDWRLLFEGEMTHLRVSQTATSRSISLVCQDLTNYWSHCYQYFINNQHGQLGSPTEIATFVNGIDADGQPRAQLQTIYNVDLQGSTGDIVLNSILRPNRNTVPLGLMDLLYKIGGEAQTADAGDPNKRGINRFFRDAEQRLRMARRIFMIPDPNIAKFLKTKAGSALAYISQFTGSLSGLGTVADVVKKFLGHCFYDYVSFLAPPFGANPSREVTATGGVDNNPATFPLTFPNGSVPISTMLTTMFKPKTYFMAAPRCNVFYPSKISSFQYAQSFLDEPSRLRLKIAQGLPGDNVPSTIGFQEQVVYAPPVTNAWNPPAFLLTEAQQTKTLADNANAGQAITVANIQSVIRDYGWGGPGGTYAQGENLIFDNTRSITEPETGIIPVFDTLDQTQGIVIGELATAGLPDDPIQTKLEKLLNYPAPTDSTNENARNRLRYYMAAANYQLDVRKFAERVVTGIEGGFNPNLLVGFPAVILNSMGIIKGELASVTHRIDSKNGATTVCQMTHAQTFPLPSFLSTMSPSQLSSIVFLANTGLNGSFLKDPVTGKNVGVVRSPIDSTEKVISDRKDSDFPVFINDNFKLANIGAQVYGPVFGTASVFDRVTAGSILGSSGADQYAAAFAQYVDYLIAPDKVSFVNRATDRNITRLFQLRAHYGNATVEPPQIQEQWPFLNNGSIGDEFLFGSEGAGPVFKALQNSNGNSKQKAVMDLTQDMRISMGLEAGINIDTAPVGTRHRAGAASGA